MRREKRKSLFFNFRVAFACEAICILLYFSLLPLPPGPLSYNSLSLAASLPTILLPIFQWLLLQPVSHYLLPLPPIHGSMMSSLVSEVKIPAKALLPIFTRRFVETESTLSKMTNSGEEKKYLQHSYRQLKNQGFPSSFCQKIMLLQVGVWRNLQRFLSVSK